jgi:hypothetical protein
MVARIHETGTEDKDTGIAVLGICKSHPGRKWQECPQGDQYTFESAHFHLRRDLGNRVNLWKISARSPSLLANESARNAPAQAWLIKPSIKV